jgi:hypothetical protein
VIGPPLGGVRGKNPPVQGFGGSAPQKKKKSSRNMSHFFFGFHVASIFVSIVGQFFDRWFFFADGFLFLVKELGLLTNPGHWVRVLDVPSSNLHIVLKTMYHYE